MSSLVLGNGASRAFSPAFGYESLLQEARSEKRVGDKEKRVGDTLSSLFEALKTVDFEQVLRILWHARMVHGAFNIDAPQVNVVYEELREALIETVAAVHPKYQECSQHLTTTGEFLKRFKKVVSLNYDFLVYWVILHANQIVQGRHFKDCFIDGRFDTNLDKLSEPYDTDACTLVFYAHGNLALITDQFGNESKISSEGGGLMDQVFDAWQNGKGIPLFVSEGKSDQKLAAIRRSHYLNFVYDCVLKKLGESVLVYGFSFGENDDHIIDAFCHSNVRRLAISVFPGDGPQAKTYCHYVSSVLSGDSQAGYALPSQTIVITPVLRGNAKTCREGWQ